VVDDAETRRPTIYDVATEAGVSKSLVSLVLRGSTQVSPARRAAVEAAIDRLRYQPSHAAAALAGHRTRTVGVVLDDYRNLWFVPLLDGIQETLAPLGYRVTVAASTVNAHVELTPMHGFSSLRVEGVIVATEPTAEMQSVRGLPVVIAGRRQAKIRGSDIATNNDHGGGRLATEHLLELGHRQIAHLSGAGGAARARERGFRAAMKAAGLAPVVLGHDAGTTEQDGFETAGTVLDARPEITALFAANDLMAFGAAAAARDRGLDIPRDLSLIGYDDSPIAASYLLQLTTVDGRSHAVGVAAAQALLARIDDPTRPPQTTLIDPQLLVRHTTQPPP